MIIEVMLTENVSNNMGIKYKAQWANDRTHPYFWPPLFLLYPRSFFTPQNRFGTPFSYGEILPQLRELTI